MAWGSGMYPSDLPLAVNTCWAIRRLCRKNAENSTAILNSGILKHISSCLDRNIKNNEFAEHICHAVINMTYRNKENKLRIEDYQLLEKIVRIFAHFSKGEDLCQKNVLASLKCIANLTVIPKNAETCAKCGITKHFQDYFKRHQEPLRSQILLGVIGNMGYDYLPQVLKIIVSEGAVQIIAEAVEHFYKLEDTDTCNCAVDALGTIAHNKQICALIAKYPVVAPILKMLKGLDYNEDLVYKTTRCLYRICIDESIRKETIQRKGHEVTAGIIDRHFAVEKILFNSLRLMNTLVAIRDTETLHEAADTGVIDTLIRKFKRSLGRPVIIELFLLLTKLSYIPESALLIGRKFGGTCIRTLGERAKDKPLVKTGADLLAILSQQRGNIEGLHHNQFLKLGAHCLKVWSFEPSIGVPLLQVIAEFAKYSEEMKQECLNSKIDDKVEDLLQTIDSNHEPLYHQEAKTVLLLLRGELSSTNKTAKNKKYIEEEDDMEIPIDMIQFLTAGKTMKLFASDGKQRTFHVLLSKDLKHLLCKRPNERRVKQKWTMPVSGIRNIEKGYDAKNKGSYFMKGAGYFGKKPDPTLCFTIYGPITKDEKQAFSFVADNDLDVDEWVKSLDFVIRADKVKKKNRLNKKKM